MKKSKIKLIESIKNHTNSYGTTIYHNLEMVNGDKINIGKKKLQIVGWEIMYEIVDSGQEYNKAKSIKQNDFESANTGELKDSSTQKIKGNPQVNINDSILYQVCLKEASVIIGMDGWDGKTEMKDKCKYLTDIAFQLSFYSKTNISNL